MNLARLVAAGFGTGYAPFAAGTVASAAALIGGAVLLALSPYALLLAAILATLGGWWAVQAARVEGDPGWVVIDEFAGQWITLLGLAEIAPFGMPGALATGGVTPMGLAAAFVLFRVLDITKPGPIGWADRQHGSFGIMADDVIAGLIGAVILLAAQRLV